MPARLECAPRFLSGPPPNKSLDASGISGLLINNLSVSQLLPAASTQPLCCCPYHMNRMMRKLPLMVVLLISSSAIAFAQKSVSNYCEEHSAFLDVISQKALVGEGKDGVVIAIARLGSGESSKELSRRRLENVRVYLLNRLPEGKLIIATGERVNELGRVEMYLGGKLVETLLANRNKDLCVACCDIDESYYPYRKDKRRRPR